MNKNKKAFTLVELIVVITILAILGTIAFISLQGYSKDARDSVRISDISKIKTSLELFQLNAGKYPETTTPTNITYSGAIAWTQGTFGTATFGNVSKLDKVPLDPVTDRQYVYSVTNTKQEYQIAGIMEGDEVTGLFNQTNAALKTAMVKISGNYNGKLLKVSTGGTDYVLAVPSIITSSGFTLEQIVTNKYLAYNGYKNLPSQYAGSSYDVLGEQNLNLVNNLDLVVYSGDLKTLSSTEPAGIDARKNLIIKLQSAYASTSITSVGEISQILNTQTTNTGSTEALSTTIVSNNLGGSISASSGGQTVTNSCKDSSKPTDNGHITFTVGTPTSANQDYVKDATSCGYECIDGYTGIGCITAPVILTYKEQGLCDLPDYHVPTGCTEGSTGCYVVAACNLGATTAGITASSYGDYFQWGNNTGRPSGTRTPSTSLVDTSSYGPGNYYNSMTFIGGSTLPSPQDWSSPKNDNLWGEETNTNIARKGPCPTGYHIPSKSDWTGLVIAGGWGGSGTNMMTALKLPKAGYRHWYEGAMREPDTEGHYWSSSIASTNYGNHLQFSTNYAYPDTNHGRAYAKTIRCFKN